MSIKFKKIVAREFLIFIGIVLLTSTIYSSCFLYNQYIKYRKGRLIISEDSNNMHVSLCIKRVQVDSLYNQRIDVIRSFIDGQSIDEFKISMQYNLFEVKRVWRAINLNALYDGLALDYQIGTLDEFKDKMNNSDKVRSLYAAVSKEYNLGDYQTFVYDLGSQSHFKKSAKLFQFYDMIKSDKSIKEVPTTYQKFYESMQYPNVTRELHHYLVKNGVKGIPDNYNVFVYKLGLPNMLFPKYESFEEFKTKVAILNLHSSHSDSLNIDSAKNILSEMPSIMDRIHNYTTSILTQTDINTYFKYSLLALLLLCYPLRLGIISVKWAVKTIMLKENVE